MKPFASMTPPALELPTDYTTLSPLSRRRVREEYICRQDGRCHHCNEPLTEEPAGKILALEIDEDLFPKNFFVHPIHLHHNHFTGMTIGAVHARCNAVLWQYHGE